MSKDLQELENAESIDENICGKKGALYGYDATGKQWRRLAVDSDGQVKITGGGAGAESDPIVGAVSGLVRADGEGNISAATEGTDYTLVESVGELPTPAVSGKLIKLITDKRIYFGLET